MSIEEFNDILNNGPKVSKPKERHGNPEHQLQCACVSWFRYQYPKHFITAIPNAAKRSVIMGAMMKAEGMVTGVPDLLIPIAKNGYNVLWIEMKNGKKGRLSDAQKEIHKKLESIGNLVKVVRTKEEFIEVVNEYLN